jgi:hypothetical protein
MSRYRHLLVISILPIALGLLSLYFLSIRGAFWLGPSSDPEYAYLLNSLNFIERKEIGHTDHPGTPLQVLGGAVIFALSQPDRDYNQVLVEPERFLAAISLTLIAANVLVIWICGYLLYRQSGRYFFSIIIQLIPFLSTTLLTFGSTRASPEPLLFTSVTLFSTLLLSYFWLRKQTSRRSFKSIALASLIGLSLGFGIAVKVTVLPLFAIPVIVLYGLRERLAYMISTALAVIIFTFPVASQYPRIISWLTGIATHEEKYGTGKAGFGNLDIIANNIAQNHLREPLLIFTYLVTAGIIVYLWRRRTAWRDHFLEIKYLIALIITLSAGHVIVGRHNEIHYLVPLITLSSLLLALGSYTLVHLGPNRLRRYLFIISIISLGVLAIGAINGALRSYQNLQAMQVSTTNVQAMIETSYPDYCQAYYYRSSSEDYALRFGDDFSLHLQQPDLATLRTNPLIYSYNIWDGLFYDWEGSIEPIDLFNKCGGKVLLIGRSFIGNYAHNAPQFAVVEVTELANPPAAESAYLMLSADLITK